MTEKKPEYTVDDARAMLVEERKRRTSACWSEIEHVLKKHNCTLDGTPEFVPSSAGYTVQVRIWVNARDN